ncbi:MAG: hypothetical protein OXI23_05225 [Gemmatimonadota bacterium]|nr:hypothetical protein [Gemmatimonadota bacterium]
MSTRAGIWDTVFKEDFVGLLSKFIKEFFGAPPQPSRGAQQNRQSPVRPKPDPQHQVTGVRYEKDSYSELLKQATALKRQGDIDGALLKIDRAIAMARPGDRGRPAAQKKRIYYLLSTKRTEDALKSANQIIAEAPEEAQGNKALVGTCYSYGYRERARVFLAMKNSTGAFMDYARATWHWHQAMSVQGRAKDEHTPERAADELVAELGRCGMPARDTTALQKAVLEGLRNPDPETMVSSLHQFIQKDQA